MHAAQGYCRPYSLSLQPHDTAGCHQRQFEQDRELPTEEQLDELYKKADTPEENPEKEEDEADISSLSVEELRKAKSNAKSKITKARNMLLYSSESKPKDGKENPLPDCPNA